MKHQDLIKRMTLEEKASLMSGANFWNTKSVERLAIPSLMLTDGPHGLRKQAGDPDHLGLHDSVPATCFPTAATLANSWNPDLLYRIGQALGKEAKAEGVSVLLGPGLNIKRNPLAGRNFEYFSEDPLLSGKMAAALIRGIQSEDVGASVKHFAVNSQEKHRMSIDEVVDERALHELYLEGFRIAVQEGKPWTVMSSYNKVNGTYANEHPELLQEILRDRWGFDGLIVTDWGGNNDRVEAMKAGNALEMPSTGGITDAQIVEAVRSGELDEGVLDKRVLEVLQLIKRTKNSNPLTAHFLPPADLEANQRLAVHAAEESLVLLKNARPGSPSPLPLAPHTSVAVIGDFADDLRIQGAGSSRVNPTVVERPVDVLREAGLNVVGFEAGYKRHGGTSARMRQRAVTLADKAEETLLLIGLDESLEAEAADRPHMRIPREQLRLLHDLMEAGHDPIVILVGGSPVELPFADLVGAILHGYLPGQGGARAIAKIVTGQVTPSGKLAETYPLTYEDVPSSTTYGKTQSASYHRESIYLGYRYYDKVGKAVRFPFGHGLSYTQFEYSDLKVSSEGVRVTVANVGDREGCEVVQVYVAPKDSDDFVAPQELTGFARVCMQPGQSRTVEIPFSEHAFSVFDTAKGGWRERGGHYRVLVGASSRDIRLSAQIKRSARHFQLAYDRDALPHYYGGDPKSATRREFATLLGRTPPPQNWDPDAPITRDSIFAELEGRGGVGGALNAAARGASLALHKIGKPMWANNINFVMDAPMRSVSRFSAGAFPEGALDGVIDVFNGKVFAGARQVISELRAARETDADTNDLDGKNK